MNMSKIKILPDNLANQIAAGEVVERPASVIKELLENSIDAGAKNIKIEVELGGRRLMRITDDGIGMNRDDAVLAFERHATSKISELADLGNIRTLGFRGEALASIASVARVEMITKQRGEMAAAKVRIEGGKLIDVGEAAGPEGTSITVRELFFNTPARRKFMRSEATENYHMTSVITHYALSNPGISFIYLNNGREKIRAAPARNLRERAYQLFGGRLIESLLPVEGGREYIAEITGFVSAPRERRTSKDAQYFFINGRFVRDKVITGGLLEGYRSVLPHGVYPVAFLFLQVPPEELDVNVHPAKTEVRFRRAEAVKDVIAETIRNSLRSAGITGRKRISDQSRIDRSPEDKEYTLEPERTGIGARSAEDQPEFEFPVTAGETENRVVKESEQEEKEKRTTESTAFELPVSSTDFEAAAGARQRFSTSREEPSETEDYPEIKEAAAESVMHETEEDQEMFSDRTDSVGERILPPFDSAEKIPQRAKVEDISAARIRPIGQLHNSFIIAADDEGMLLIDQHVAHERILFDKFRRQEDVRKIESQNLLVPETIDLTPAQAEAFEEVREELERCGFGLMRLSGRTVAIKSVPTDLPPAEVHNLFSEILDTVEKEKRGRARATLRDEIAASLACKAAVKINMKLTPEKMRWMIDRLLKTSSPTTCPHGRPIILRLTMRDIERRFHRS